MSRDVCTTEDPADGEDPERNVISETIREAIDKKKRQQEKEIEDYKAQKERELKHYEQELIKETLEREDDISKNTTDNGEAMSREHQAQSPAIKDFGEVDGFRDTIKSDSSRTRDVGSIETATIESLVASSETPSVNIQDEVREEKGDVTPRVLPSINAERLEERSIQLDATARDNASYLSSSAIDKPALPHPSFPDLESLQEPLSSSAPLLDDSRSTHYRSDSSASNISITSLRSSMRDPKQPKSPKRVQFSLGNDVVSPSTSPVVTRKSVSRDAGMNGGESVENVLDWGKKPRRKKKNRRKERGSGTDGEEDLPRGRQVKDGLEDLGLSERRGFVSLVEGWTQSIPMAIAPIPASTATMASKTDGFGKNKRIDDDDLFTFDEDLDTGTTKSSTNATSADENLFDEEDDDPSKNQLHGTSPHAGSLPIEIKFPERRDAGG